MGVLISTVGIVAVGSEGKRQRRSRLITVLPLTLIKLQAFHIQKQSVRLKKWFGFSIKILQIHYRRNKSRKQWWNRRWKWIAVAVFLCFGLLVFRCSSFPFLSWVYVSLFCYLASCFILKSLLSHIFCSVNFLYHTWFSVADCITCSLFEITSLSIYSAGFA